MGRKVVEIFILLNVELLGRGYVHRAEAEAVSVCRGIGIRAPCAQVLIRGVQRLRKIQTGWRCQVNVGALGKWGFE